MRGHGWQIAISVVGAVFLTAHLIWPSFKIDSITVALLIICCLPWLGRLFKSLEMPGGWKFEFQEFAKAAEKARESGLLTSGTERAPSPSYFGLIETDPRLAVVGLRIDIETRLRRIAALHNLAPRPTGIFSIMGELERLGVLTTAEGMALGDILSSLNSAAHGALIPKETAEQVLEVGSRLLDSLDKRFPPPPTPTQ